eukprot:CAMPEP_0115093848 /NCGR_PEP_ID=MMETSP0227-20121206/27889_1 /TAXON_ID=89957 /ORGANISM="Polarella glacialis, Strain CCMP 1383" /LENGTH=369 /DNA_ID=CAMNT_0002486503 /DNA_START=38 /DNA_END=1148 /DNA_ORIENTATION=-
MAWSPRGSPSQSVLDREGFPPRSSVTFGEVVSSFNRSGNVASRRHGGVYISQHSHMPSNKSTIHDKTVNMQHMDRDAARSILSSSSRQPMSARSRTPSPWTLSGRPRSLPATPRRLGERMKEWSDVGVAEPYSVPGLQSALEARLGAHAVLCAIGAATGGGGTGGSLGVRAGLKGPVADLSPRSPPSRGARLREQNYVSSASSLGQSQQPPSRPPPLWGGAGTGSASAAASLAGTTSRFGGLAAGGSHTSLGAASEPYYRPESRDSWCREPLARSPSEKAAGFQPSGDPRALSFVRLNGFLLRTHITSLISALAEDGWLEAWEKERLCSIARQSDSSHHWAQTFLRVYTRFIETDDVPTFVAGLRAQIA